ncbi:hypothetical protein RIF29_16414 [Crotalaria pallida]|uniref:F-box domain-containing protein n=1 Tax=Crotalaria pallida TaxID=3830 RepID=A0AAN9IDJ6_CROPI
MSMTRMDKNKRVLHHLPHDLIVLILLRLPVKSLLRFKCVSKFFFSLISDDQFAVSHFDLAASPTHRLLCLAYVAGTAYASLPQSIDLDDDSASSSVALIPRFLPRSCNPLIMGSCKGFILLCHGSHHLYIWNPSTGAHKKLPLSSDPKKHKPIYYGLGYDASTNDFLVFLGSFDLEVEDHRKIDFELFSLRANAWKTIEGNHLPYLSVFPRTGKLLNGVLHWLTYRRDIETIVILAFDLMEKSFSEMPLPPMVDFYSHFHECSDLCVLDGYLCLYVPGNNATKIWVMNEYKVSSSWKKSVELCMTTEAINAKNKMWKPKHYFSPRYSTKCGDIVGLNDGTRVVKFNAKGQLLEHHHSYCVDPCADICEAVMYTESLLSFPSC